MLIYRDKALLAIFSKTISMCFSFLLRSLLFTGTLYITMSGSFADTPQIESKNAPVISLQNQGKIQGIFDRNLVIFKGVPYASPPVQSFRWLPPQPVQKWQGIKETTRFAPICSQKATSWDTDPALKNTSEDCLYLNIWAPKAFFDHPQDQHLYPVMVWIHGGAFVSGGSSLEIYNPSALAQQGIVVVSFNYRLGRFGFFAHPALKQESEEDQWANYGLMDQIAALKWVKNNIISFGGDSNNVTVFGESAGGASIISLMTITDAKGLFDKAIIQSGTGHSKAFPLTPQNQAEAIGINFAQKHHILSSGVDALQELRSLPTDYIIDDLNIQNLQPNLFAGLIIDQTLLTQSLEEAYVKGDFYPVPLLIGDTDGDGLLLSKTSLADLAKDLHTTTEAINHIYNPDNKKSESSIIHQLIADTQILEPTRQLAHQVASKNKPVYRFRFSYIADAARSYSSFGATHASEIPYIFDNLSKAYRSVSNQDHAMAKAIMMSWVNFAKNGNPSVQGFPIFLPINQAPEQLLHFGMDGIKFEKDPFKNRLDFIESIFTKKNSKNKQDIPVNKNLPKYPTR
ncbi:Carboxylesterase type B (PnbA) (PDB:1K4Y) [Commensalibacter papalotli (ex Botero et al. 2024)]|uniref:Carboxylic ester hydrolase n=2 Tax=Commensalibacter papalotli (ex Botero et al. 2024) TaxID=2972766 RepID=A0ABM9HIK3_9PROT|nr:Carboxylesterase type B (PnbA) (PDB:1K4Y) [Commensalibacter papalotli (ex Botero et al. 2024)]CAI3926848.1 Carboxylesterase type B (PnbA) (PDB:1K4Y) [Commensalibacter papalotli (ex Botero et al. 2024)]